MTNNKQQTAVEWLEIEVKKFNTVITKEYILLLCQQAKEMQFLQNANTWNNAINAVEKDKWESFEQYYNETYGGNK